MGMAEELVKKKRESTVAERRSGRMRSGSKRVARLKDLRHKKSRGKNGDVEKVEREDGRDDEEFKGHKGLEGRIKADKGGG